MRKIATILVVLLLSTISLYPQTRHHDKTVQREDKTTLKFKVKGDYTGAKLYFTVKEDRDSSNRLIDRRNLLAGGDSSQIYATYSDPKTTIYVTIRSQDTQDFTKENFVYDVESISASDSTDIKTLFDGNFNVKGDVRRMFDGFDLPDNGRIFWVIPESGTYKGDILSWDSTANGWRAITVDSLKQIIGAIAAADTTHGVDEDNIIYGSDADIDADNTNKKIILDADSIRATGKLKVDGDLAYGDDGNISEIDNNLWFINSKAWHLGIFNESIIVLDSTKISFQIDGKSYFKIDETGLLPYDVSRAVNIGASSDPIDTIFVSNLDIDGTATVSGGLSLPNIPRDSTSLSLGSVYADADGYLRWKTIALISSGLYTSDGNELYTSDGNKLYAKP